MFSTRLVYLWVSRVWNIFAIGKTKKQICTLYKGMEGRLTGDEWLVDMVSRVAA
jgi:hypothetical protein